MAITTRFIEPGWDAEFVFGNIWCPVCGGTKFVELVPAGGVWCDQCNTKFWVTGTAGDPGVVVHASPKHAWWAAKGHDPADWKHSAYFWKVMKIGELEREWCYLANQVSRFKYLAEPIGHPV